MKGESDMRAKDIIIGQHYRHRTNTSYGWAKALKVVPPKTGVNTNSFIVVECEWAQQKDDKFALRKYFRPADLVAA